MKSRLGYLLLLPLSILMIASLYAQTITYKTIKTITHYSYQIPSNWEQMTSNSYGVTNGGQVIEGILQGTEISESYCKEIVYYLDPAKYEITVKVDKIYNNGKVEGCYRELDLKNKELNKTWHKVYFIFPDKNGIQELTIQFPKELFDEKVAKTIIDSVSLN